VRLAWCGTKAKRNPADTTKPVPGSFAGPELQKSESHSNRMACIRHYPARFTHVAENENTAPAPEQIARGWCRLNIGRREVPNWLQMLEDVFADGADNRVRAKFRSAGSARWADRCQAKGSRAPLSDRRFRNYGKSSLIDVGRTFWQEKNTKGTRRPERYARRAVRISQAWACHEGVRTP